MGKNANQVMKSEILGLPIDTTNLCAFKNFKAFSEVIAMSNVEKCFYTCLQTIMDKVKTNPLCGN